MTRCDYDGINNRMVDEATPPPPKGRTSEVERNVERPSETCESNIDIGAVTGYTRRLRLGKRERIVLSSQPTKSKNRR